MANKYGNKKTIYDGITFDSKTEAFRYSQLKAKEQSGMITNLQRQVRFELLPSQREPDTLTKTGKVKQGRVIFRAWTYTADFVYECNGKEVVEDVKGIKPPRWSEIEKMMFYVHKKRISIVWANDLDRIMRSIEKKKRSKKQ